MVVGFILDNRVIRYLRQSTDSPVIRLWYNRKLFPFCNW